MRASLIAATYNQVPELELFFQSAARQKCQDFEILLADDGSGEETRACVAKWQAYFGASRLSHFWQENKGFRKAKILNRAIAAARSPYLIFCDSDCVMHPLFVCDHLSMQRPNGIFLGRRVDLGKEVTEWLKGHPSQLFSLRFYARVLGSAWGGGTRHLNRAFRVAPLWVAKLLGYDRVPDLLGSNFSICAELFHKVNGFDETHVHYGCEDSDLYIRARNAGGVVNGRKAYALQFHLWHPRRAFLPGAEENYNRRLHSDYESQWAVDGLTKDKA